MSNSRIPEQLADFDKYITTAIPHLSTLESGGIIKRGETLGLTSAEMHALEDESIKWASGDPDNPGVYDLHKNPTTKNTVTRKNVLNFKADFGRRFRPMLNRMATSLNIITSDRVVLRIAEPKSSHTRPEAPIKEICVPFVEARPAAKFNMGVRLLDDASRCKIPVDATAVQLNYAVCEGKLKATPDLALKVKSKCDNPYDGTTSVISTKARFAVQIDPTLSGYDLHCYFRFINIHYPELAGEWTQKIVVNIA